jgi:hypothetical protein
MKKMMKKIINYYCEAMPPNEIQKEVMKGAIPDFKPVYDFRCELLRHCNIYSQVVNVVSWSLLSRTFHQPSKIKTRKRSH